MAEGGAFGVGKGGVPGYIAGGGKGLVRWSGNLGGHGRGWKGSPWLGTGMEEWGLVGAVEGWRFWLLFRQERGIPTSPLCELLIGNDRMFCKEQVQGVTTISNWVCMKLKDLRHSGSEEILGALAEAPSQNSWVVNSLPSLNLFRVH